MLLFCLPVFSYKVKSEWESSSVKSEIKRLKVSSFLLFGTRLTDETKVTGYFHVFVCFANTDSQAYA